MIRRSRAFTGRRRNSIHSLLSADAASNAVSILPLPLQQVVTDERSLLTVPWTMMFQDILGQIQIPTYLEGTHADRLDPETDPGNFRIGTVFYETDRNVYYQARIAITPPATEPAPFWQYMTGTMWGTMTPDERPTDLGVHDAGFEFRSTDLPARQFLWSQTAWVEVGAASGSGDAQIAYATGNLTLTTTATDISGASIVLARIGRYLITGNFTFQIAGDTNQAMRGTLAVSGANQLQQGLVMAPATNTVLGTTQQWLITVASTGETVVLRGHKDGGTGTSSAIATLTSISAIWIST